MAFNSNLAVFSFVVFVFGLILTYLTVDQQTKISNQCVSKNVQTGLNLILMLSLMMTIIPLIQLFCHWNCGHPQNDPPIGYRSIVIGLCVLLATAGGFVWNGLDNEPNCKLGSALSYMKSLVLSTSFLAAFLLISPLLPVFKDMFGNSIGGGGSVRGGSVVNLDEV